MYVDELKLPEVTNDCCPRCCFLPGVETVLLSGLQSVFVAHQGTSPSQIVFPVVGGQCQITMMNRALIP